jgi:hypothetical protein
MDGGAPAAAAGAGEGASPTPTMAAAVVGAMTTSCQVLAIKRGAGKGGGRPRAIYIGIIVDGGGGNDNRGGGGEGAAVGRKHRRGVNTTADGVDAMMSGSYWGCAGPGVSLLLNLGGSMTRKDRAVFR